MDLPKMARKPRKPMTEQQAFSSLIMGLVCLAMGAGLAVGGLGEHLGEFTGLDVLTGGIVTLVAGAWFLNRIPKGFRMGTRFAKDKPAMPEIPRKMDTQAVSPVIAVILMVAITVVLAATVFVLVSDIGAPPAAPTLSFREDTANRNLTVIQAQTGLTWGEFTITGCPDVPPSTDAVNAGDSLGGCTGRVTIRHNPSNSLTYTGEFPAA